MELTTIYNPMQQAADCLLVQAEKEARERMLVGQLARATIGFGEQPPAFLEVLCTPDGFVYHNWRNDTRCGRFIDELERDEALEVVAGSIAR